MFDQTNKITKRDDSLQPRYCCKGWDVQQGHRLQCIDPTMTLIAELLQAQDVLIRAESKSCLSRAACLVHPYKAY